VIVEDIKPAFAREAAHQARRTGMIRFLIGRPEWK
jgi:hypothetical protein